MLFQIKKAVRVFPSLSISFRCAVIGIFMKVMTRWYYKLLCQVRTHAYTTRICVLVRFWAPATIRRSVIIKHTTVHVIPINNHLSQSGTSTYESKAIVPLAVNFVVFWPPYFLALIVKINSLKLISSELASYNVRKLF